MGQVLGCDGPRYDREGRELNTPREASDVDEIVIKDKDGEIVRDIYIYIWVECVTAHFCFSPAQPILRVDVLFLICLVSFICLVNQVEAEDGTRPRGYVDCTLSSQFRLSVRVCTWGVVGSATG
jgi:hypothetical protein